MRVTSVISLFIYALFVALGHILQKTTLNLKVDPMVFSFLRIGCGFIIISSIILIKRSNPLKIVKANLRHFIILGVIFSGMGILIKLWGLSHTTATNASFIMSLSSVTAIAFAFLLLKEKVPPRFALISLIMVGGIYMITTKGEQLIPQKGDLIILGLVFLIGFMQVYGKHVLRRISVLETAFGRSLFGMLFLGLAALVLSPGGFASISSFQVLLLVLSNGITFSGSIIFFYIALQREGASQASMFALLVPLFTTFMGRLFLGETLNFLQIIGGVIILLGAALISRIKIKQANF